jgi:hypothetical protein
MLLLFLSLGLFTSNVQSEKQGKLHTLYIIMVVMSEQVIGSKIITPRHTNLPCYCIGEGLACLGGKIFDPLIIIHN